jgi:hypothetical protein
MNDGRTALILTKSALAKLTPHASLVLRWLEDCGLLLRDVSSAVAKGKPGKRQRKMVIGKDEEGANIRPRVYVLVGGVSAIKRAAGMSD